jgi:hypothetical protein
MGISRQNEQLRGNQSKQSVVRIVAAFKASDIGGLSLWARVLE